MKNLIYLSLLAFFTLLTLSCEKDNGDDPGDDTNGNGQEDTLQLYSFTFHELDPQVEANIDHQELTIQASIPRSANIKNLAFEAEYPDGATLAPPSGYAYDFSNPLTFTLEKGTESLSYTSHIDFSAVDDNDILSVSFPDLFRKGEIDGNTISLEVPYGTPLTEVEIEMEVSDFATVSPESGSTVDISSPLEIIVTAENGDEQSYTLEATEMNQETGVRAFWVPDPAHSTFLRSYEDMQEGVALAKELNFNTLYVVAWARTNTLYPSQVLADHSSFNDAREGMFRPAYTGVSGDPLEDLIDLAHAEGLKVILWYEYGFMARVGTIPTPDNDKILEQNPHWAGWGRNSAGDTIPSAYNLDYYYNAYHPEVQQFMKNLVMEAVENYNIDGIQGDDRMPAMPSNSGYDYYTRARYKEEHDGQDPPSPSNVHWKRWRADILNEFGQELYDAVKAHNPDMLVTNSPNPYPWAYNNLLQDWPQWLDDGNVEILSVQCYRYSIEAYRATINEVMSYFSNHGDGLLKRLSPGLILYGTQGLTDAELLAEKIKYNRSIGITGESFFYDVPLHEERIQRVIRAMYPAPAHFPEF